MDIVEFLRARLDEDEARARDFEEQHGHALNGDYGGQGHRDAVNYWQGVETIGMPPARVLREVEAKRRMIAHAEDNPLTVDWWWRVEEDLLRLLALPYAGHPDYQQEWAP